MEEEVILLTTSQVESFREEAASIRKQIADLQEELRRVNMKLTAAAMLFGKDQSEAIDGNLTQAISRIYNGGIVISQKVLRIIETSEVPVTKKEIGQKLNEIGIYEANLSPNYLHIVLRRLVKKGAISKDGRQYKAN